MSAKPVISRMSGIDFNGNRFSLHYPWIKTDAGRSGSKRNSQSNDCTVRALAIARSLDYDVAYDLLAAEGRKSGKGFHMHQWLNMQPWAHKIPFPAIKGQRRMNPSDFVAQHPNGVYICKVAKHVFAVIDGVVYDDSENRPDRCIYTAWEIK